MSSETRRRRPGSVRFDPYFKVQRWLPESLAWRDVQRAYASEEEAAAVAAEEPGRWRIMRVFPGGRRPVREGET